MRVSRTRLISKGPRERFQDAFRKLIGEALMNHLTLAASRRERFAMTPPYEQTLLHAWHAIQSRGGRRQLRHCASTCLFASCECLVRFTVNAVTFRKGHLLWHRMRVTEGESHARNDGGRGRGGEEGKKQ